MTTLFIVYIICQCVRLRLTLTRIPRTSSNRMQPGYTYGIDHDRKAHVMSSMTRE